MKSEITYSYTFIVSQHTYSIEVAYTTGRIAALIIQTPKPKKGFDKFIE
jgi:hypothetical protein